MRFFARAVSSRNSSKFKKGVAHASIFLDAAYQPMFNQPIYNQAMYGGAFPGFQTNPYYAGVLPRPVFQVPHVPFSPEITHGMSPVSFPGFGMSGYLSPENFISGYGKTPGNYLPPEFLEFLRAELLRCGKSSADSCPCP